MLKGSAPLLDQPGPACGLPSSRRNCRHSFFLGDSFSPPPRILTMFVLLWLPSLCICICIRNHICICIRIRVRICICICIYFLHPRFVCISIDIGPVRNGGRRYLSLLLGVELHRRESLPFSPELLSSIESLRRSTLQPGSALQCPRRSHSPNPSAISHNRSPGTRGVAFVTEPS